MRLGKFNTILSSVEQLNFSQLKKLQGIEHINRLNDQPNPEEREKLLKKSFSAAMSGATTKAAKKIRPYMNLGLINNVPKVS